MTARQIGRADAGSQARLQLLLVLLAAWDLLAFLLQLMNSRLLGVEGIRGVLGARSVGGSLAVLAVAYLYAARNPVRYRFVLWLAALEQLLTLFAAAFHWVRGDVGAGESMLPIVASTVLLMLLIANLPRQTDAR